MSSVVSVVENPARDLSSIDVDAARVDRALRAVREAKLRGPPILEVEGATLVLECTQITGSFKVRGAVAAITANLDAARARGIVAVSAGNHGAGVAWAAERLGVRAIVVVPRTAPGIKRRRITDRGAELQVVDTDHYDDAERVALEVARDRSALFVSPYDDPDVVAGNGGTLGLDVVTALGRAPGVVLAPVGGGGLVSGLAVAFGASTQVWGVQSSACPAMARSLSLGAAIEAMSAVGPTLAEGLEGGVSRGGFTRARAALAGVMVVDERAVAQAMMWAREELGMTIEGSSAVVLVPLLAGHALARGAVVIVSGRNVD